MKWVAAAPLLARIAARELYEKAASAVGKDARDNIYKRLGVKTVINCRGTWTYLSGSLEWPEVRAAQLEAARHFVNMIELQRAAGQRLAELTGAESGMVTSGAAGAMTAATAASIAGSDPNHIWQLPDTSGLRDEVIMVGGRSAFDSAIRLAGGKLVLVFSPEEIESAINDKTAMIYTTHLGETLEKELAIAKAHSVPLLLDDAAGIPPIENIKLYARMRVDLYTFSGGKGLCGPQCSGLLLGRSDLIEAARLNTNPYEGAVGRPMKVGKEEVMGCLAALETWLKLDSKALYRRWNERVERIATVLDTVRGVKTEIHVPDDGNRYPTLRVSWDQKAWGFSVADCVQKLREGDPVIEVLGPDNPSLVAAVREGNPNRKELKQPDRLELVSMTIQPGEEVVVGQRLRAILLAARKRMQNLGSVIVLLVLGALILAKPSAAQQLTNDYLALAIKAQDGTYQLAVRGGQPILTSRVAAEVNHQWLRSSDFPHHEASESTFSDDLGSGRAVTVRCGGLDAKPDLVYVVQLYEQHSYATVAVKLRNTTAQEVTVQAIRGIEAFGEPVLNLAGHASADRILSDSFSEDWPELRLHDLGKAPGGMHRGAGSQLIYNRESKQSLFVGALTSDRFLTLLHLQATGTGTETKIASYSVDSVGTTEVQKDFDLKDAPAEDQIELSLPVKPGTDMVSERVMLEAGRDYHNHLLAYGDAIRQLHHARVSTETPIGWWSWTAFYGAINEGETLANADWQSEHLRSLGYTYFQIDEGYQYARGEYSTANATQFPEGMSFVGQRLTEDGLTFGIWTGPFEVTSRAWVYEHHKDWLVHNAKGDPIPSGKVWNQKTDVIYSLDTTHPAAQEYLRQTYKTLVREWGVRFIKLDFMDTTAIEGYRYRPNTTALEAQRIGLQIIRDTVGNDVVLDKDGSPMLNAVGLVDTGRISADTAHSFQGTKDAAPGIAARFYMNRNFFVNDPDAFNTTSESFTDLRDPPTSLPLPAAEASIALSSISGGMHEVGDDMLVLGSERDRLLLVENRDLLTMAKLGRASTPLDLMTYEAEDEQPSVFFLQESPRQAILTVFNWTKTARSHMLKLADFGLDPKHTFAAFDVLHGNTPVTLANGTLPVEKQIPESVRVIKLIDSDVSPSAPRVRAQVPSAAKAGEPIRLAAQTEARGVPAVEYHWDFGDGVTRTGARVSHTYTKAANFNIRLRVDGIDDLPAVQNFSIKVSGHLRAFPNLIDNRRFSEVN